MFCGCINDDKQRNNSTQILRGPIFSIILKAGKIVAYKMYVSHQLNYFLMLRSG